MTVHRVKVPQNEVLHDIRSGMDERAIRKKYNLSTKGLKRLYEKLAQAGALVNDTTPILRKLNLVAVLADVRAGMSGPELMAKYRLSQDMLREVSKKLLDAEGNRSARDEPETLIAEPADFVSTREFLRHDLTFELPVYDTARPDIHGSVRDVSEEGISVAGIEAKVGDIKTLVVLSDEFGDFESFEFRGRCRWFVADSEEGTCLAGFAIDEISEYDSHELQKLIQLVLLT
jgi:Mor family transcriptional regulator